MESYFFSESEVRESVNEFVLKQLDFPLNAGGIKGGERSTRVWQLGGNKAVVSHFLT